MDSQITLVSPGSEVFPDSLIFSTDSVKNATIYLRTPSSSPSSGTPLYTLSTTDKSAYRTEIRDASAGHVIATIERRDILPDLVTFDGAKAVKISKWLKREKLSDGYPVHILRNSYGEYFCKSSAKHRLALYSSADSEASVPLAYFTRSSTASAHSTITLDPGATMIREHALVAFLYLEQNMRMGENMSRVGEGMAKLDATVMHQITGGGVL